MSYHQITAAERYTLALLRRQGCTPATIARVLGRHRSTIGRELRRNAKRYRETAVSPEFELGLQRLLRVGFVSSCWPALPQRLPLAW